MFLNKNKRFWYNRIAPIYNIIGDFYYYERKNLIENINLEEGDVVIDLCCGTGRNLPLIKSQVGSSGIIIGIDISPKMLEEAKRLNTSDNIFLICIDVENLNRAVLEKILDGRKIDKIICTLGFSVVENWQSAFDKSYALLKKEGLYGILDLCYTYSNFIANIINIFASANSYRETTRLLKNNSRKYYSKTYKKFLGKVNIFIGLKK